MYHLDQNWQRYIEIFISAKTDDVSNGALTSSLQVIFSVKNTHLNVIGFGLAKTTMIPTISVWKFGLTTGKRLDHRSGLLIFKI
jgi:hypothetical protein